MSTSVMESALDATQLFANSANVVRVFEALSEGPSTNRALRERTGTARSTVGRILEKGESRGWIESEGSRYELTRPGRIMIEEFRSYLRTIEGVQHLGDDLHWLPEPAHDLDYEHFRDATIHRPTPDDPTAPFDRIEEMLRDTAAFPRMIARTVTPHHQAVSRELWDAGKPPGEMVLCAPFLETLRDDPERAEPWYEWAQLEAIWIYDGPPINLQLYDDVVTFGLGERREDEVLVTGLLESENSAVLAWAESLFEEYRAEGALLTPEMLSGA